MGTALIYLLVMIGVAAAVFVGAALIFGRGEELAPLPPGATPTRLPVGEVAGRDVRAVRFQQALRGYRMSEVDWVLDRLASELDRVETERDQLRGKVRELEREIPTRTEPVRAERVPAEHVPAEHIPAEHVPAEQAGQTAAQESGDAG